MRCYASFGYNKKKQTTPIAWFSIDDICVHVGDCSLKTTDGRMVDESVHEGAIHIDFGESDASCETSPITWRGKDITIWIEENGQCTGIACDEHLKAALTNASLSSIVPYTEGVLIRGLKLEDLELRMFGNKFFASHDYNDVWVEQDGDDDDMDTVDEE